jgi:hypothetical protein
MNHPADELLSAYIDGETAEDVAAHVGGCDQCTARAAVLLRAAAAIVDVPAPDPAAQDAAVGAALATFSPDIASANVVPLRRRVPSWAPLAAAAAAGIIAVGALVPMLGSRGGDNRAETAGRQTTTAEDSTKELPARGDAPDSAVASPAPGAAGLAPAGGPRPLGDLGELSGRDLGDLVTRAEGRGTASPPAAAPCTDPAAIDAGDRLTEWATATDDGSPVVVLVYEPAAGGPPYAVVSPPSCAPARRVPLS